MQDQDQDQDREQDISDILDRIEELEAATEQINELVDRLERLEEMVDDGHNASDGNIVYEDYLMAVSRDDLPENWSPPEELVEEVVDRRWSIMQPSHAAAACEKIKRHPGSKETKVELTAAAVRWTAIHTEEAYGDNTATKSQIDECVEEVAGITTHRKSSYRSEIQELAYAGPKQKHNTVEWEMMPTIAAGSQMCWMTGSPEAVEAVIELHGGDGLEAAASTLRIDEPNAEEIKEEINQRLGPSGTSLSEGVSADWENFNAWQNLYASELPIALEDEDTTPDSLLKRATEESYELDSAEEAEEVLAEGLERVRGLDGLPDPRDDSMVEI